LYRACRTVTSTPFFTIILVTRGEPTLPRVLESIASQDFRDFEVVIVTTPAAQINWESSGDFAYREIKVPEDTKLLKARSIGAEAARGSFSILLDATRMLRNGCLSRLAKLAPKHQMLIIPEDVIGEGFWVNLARIDRRLTSTPSNIGKSVSRLDGVVLPRVFSTPLLKAAYLAIARRLSASTFDRVVFNDHQLLFGSALSFTRAVGVADSPLIAHFVDPTLKDIFRKYYRYGASQRHVMRLEGEAYAHDLAARVRIPDWNNLGDYLKVQPLYAVRTFAFMAGFFFASGDL
jgi:glycosyltransferase involved in cell wall biosynthesis